MVAKVIGKKKTKKKAGTARTGAEHSRSTTRDVLSYLYGPGRAQEHHDPHLIASWDGLVDDPAAAASPEEAQVRLSKLAAELDRLTVIHPRRGRDLWHCAVRTAPTDRLLTDQEWNQTARELVDAAGIAPKGDPAGCRWIAVRHADDHIHIVATLRRMDGKMPNRSNDYLRLRQTCRSLEERYGLTATPPVDWTASRRATRAELGKAQRLGRDAVAGNLNTGSLMRRLPVDGSTRAFERKTTAQAAGWARAVSARDTLRRRVRSAAAAAADEPAFIRALADAGVRVRTHDLPTPGGERVPAGYEVHLPGDLTASRDPIWYAGSTLDPDLSLPRIRERWQGVVPPPRNTHANAAASAPSPSPSDTRTRAWNAAVSPLAQAARAFDTGSDTVGDAPSSALRNAATDAHRAANSQAVGDLLTIAADQAPGQIRDQLTAAAHAFERGARVPIQRTHNEVSSSLRRATQAMHAAGQAMTRRQEIAAINALILTSVETLHAALAWHRQLRLTAQAASTQRAIHHLRLAAWQLDPVHHFPDRDAAQRPDLRRAVHATLGGLIDPAQITSDPAYPILATMLHRAEHTGYDPAPVLHAAADNAEIGKAPHVPGLPLADLLAFHIQQRLNTPAPAADGPRTVNDVPGWPAHNEPAHNEPARGGEEEHPAGERYADLIHQAAREWFGDMHADLRTPELTAALHAAEQAGLQPHTLLRETKMTPPWVNPQGRPAPGADRALSKELADQINQRVTDHQHAEHPDRPPALSHPIPEKWAQLQSLLINALRNHGLADTVDQLYSPALEDLLHRAHTNGIDITALVQASANTVGPIDSAESLPHPIHRQLSDALHRTDTPYLAILRAHLPQRPGIASPDQVAAAPAWKTVLAKLRKARDAGHQPEQLLQRAISNSRVFKNADSIAKVIAWSIDHLTGGPTPSRPSTGPQPWNRRPTSRLPTDRGRHP
ncbi:relaxase/mobilization nuclease domain-containing protein [Actinomadura chibensis]|uniref:Relaxase/mobilization nuclease domain-containing protein n=1 Tax=Actinomadura chibensis TaxID=392828 RepID=A0A5D0NT42_9ACTN|nr:relaxase/mobilization nuclease domain-containing protein [Actinomadura chibensis]TYB47803.1 relaxase/mobilization nuclease domain-containing protein [Actinomadura chibensis]